MRMQRSARISAAAAVITLSIHAGLGHPPPTVSPAYAGPASADSFVSVTGDRFFLDDRPFHFGGANCYYLMVYAADVNLRPYVDEVLTETAAMGLTVIRTWAFNDGTGWNALQTAPGIYDEAVFQGLDYVLEKSRQLGLRVILPLVNNWVDYGGMDQYVAWSPTASYHDDFYSDDSCRVWYKAHASAVANRVNTQNSRVYKDDPTILAWELGNEPRCHSDPTGNTLVAWIQEMSSYIKGLGVPQLVATGIEGFYDDGSGPWYYNGSTGVDFVRDHQVADIDFATSHHWPDNYGWNFTTSMSILSRQIGDARVALQKPFVFEEFGKHRDPATGASAKAHYDPRTFFAPGTTPTAIPGAAPVLVDRDNAARAYFDDPARPPALLAPLAEDTGTRDTFFAAYYDSLYLNQCGGSNLWILYHDDYPDYDGFGIYYPADVSTIDIIMDHAAEMESLNQIPPAAITDFVATQVLQGNDLDGTTGINLSWSGVDPLSTVSVYRRGYGGYPEYNDNGGAAPSPPPDSASASNQGWTRLGTLQAGDADETPDRDFWYFVAFVIDTTGLVSPVSNMTTGTLNYHLGDVVPVGAGQTGDNSVNLLDLSKLGAHYGTAQGDGLYLDSLDVGPTVDLSRHTLPITDDLIQFEDLMVVAMNYEQVAKPKLIAPATAETPFSTTAESAVEVSLLPSLVEVDHDVVFDLEITVPVAGDSFNGYEAAIVYDPALLTFIELSPNSLQEGELMTGACGSRFHDFSESSGVIEITHVLLCAGVDVAGPGELYTLRFRAGSTAAETEVRFTAINFANAGHLITPVVSMDAVVRIGDVTGVPGEDPPPLIASVLHPSSPNPFPRSTMLSFTPAQTGRILLDIHNVSGRLIRRFVFEEPQMGTVRRVLWDGRDEHGATVPAGIYWMRLAGAGQIRTQVLVKIQ